MTTINYEQPHCPTCGRMLKEVTIAGKYECKNCGQVVMIEIEKVNKYIVEAI